MAKGTESHRVGFDPKRVGAIRHWLERWYGEALDIKISRERISFPKRVKERSAAFRNAFGGRQSPLHAYLKYVAHCHYSEIHQSLEPVSEKLGHSRPHLEYEAKIYYPNEVLLDDVVAYSGSFDIFSPQAIPKGRSDVVLDFGELKIVDLYTEVVSRATFVEVGFTDPYSLLIPLYSGFANAVVWVPFPQGHSPQEFNWRQTRLRGVTAYQLSLK